jgi:hypothetical protein
LILQNSRSPHQNEVEIEMNNNLATVTSVENFGIQESEKKGVTTKEALQFDYMH